MNATAELLNDIETFQRRFLYLPEDSYFTATTLWVAHTWAFEAASCTPYIYVNSAEKRSGKTLLMETIAEMTKNPETAQGVTGAGLFRNMVMETEEGTTRLTMFIDEVDTIWTGGASVEDMRQVLNSGFKRNGSILRATGRYSTFAPKMMAGIDNGAMPDTIKDRSIVLNLKRATDETIATLERWHERIHGPEAQALADRLRDWATTATAELREMFPAPIPVNPRAFDISEPLLAVAEMAGQEWAERSREHLTSLLSDETEVMSAGTKCLKAARDFMDTNGVDVIFSSELEQLTGIPSKAIANILRPYGVGSTTVRRSGDIAKGYRRDFFDDAWGRYL